MKVVGFDWDVGNCPESAALNVRLPAGMLKADVAFGSKSRGPLRVRIFCGSCAGADGSSTQEPSGPVGAHPQVRLDGRDGDGDGPKDDEHQVAWQPQPFDDE